MKNKYFLALLASGAILTSSFNSYGAEPNDNFLQYAEEFLNDPKVKPALDQAIKDKKLQVGDTYYSKFRYLSSLKIERSKDEKIAYTKTDGQKGQLALTKLLTDLENDPKKTIEGFEEIQEAKFVSTNNPVEPEDIVELFIYNLFSGSKNASELTQKITSKKFDPFFQEMEPEEFDNLFGALIALQQEEIKIADKKAKDANKSKEDTEKDLKPLKEVLDKITQQKQETEKNIAEKIKNFANTSGSPIYEEQVHSSILEGFGAVTLEITNRSLTNLIPPVAAGDGDMKMGAWAKGIFNNSQAKEDRKKGRAGYKSSQNGFTLGFDAGENPIGVAFSMLNGKIKPKSGTSKDASKTYLVTLYGSYKIDGNFFVSGQASLGKTDIKKSADYQRYGHTTAKKKGSIAGVRGYVGYVYDLGSGASLTPTLGLSHDSVTIKGFAEKNTAGRIVRRVGKMSASRTSGLAEIKLSGNMESGSMRIIPEIHCGAVATLNAKNPKTLITIGDSLTPISIKAGKESKVSYRLGASVKLISGFIEASVGDDFGFSKKFRSNTAYVNLRANF